MDPTRPDPTRPDPTRPDPTTPVGGAGLAAEHRPATRPSTGTGPDRLVLVHGFTQTSACWSPIDDVLAEDHELVLVDAPGHGGSAGVELDLAAGGDAIAAAGGRATYVGYSMGGRFCLHAALAHPDQVARLVLISATAGIDDDGERAERRRSDEALADHVLAVGVPAFVDEGLRLPLFAGLDDERAHRPARLANTAAGLASSLRRAGTGTQQPLWGRLAELAMPVLVVAGAADDKFTATAARMAAAIGANAELSVVPGAGHTVHLERPDRFLSTVTDWLDRTTSGPAPRR